ncbi:tripartite motif containing 71 protein wech [Leptinotarsa decemlineata]|uniref:tripartite motif containing 71 protein wech n=1 Tax=Leptinotarsa decemlineata TaxID=7539 RepID=UPI003D305B33
MDFLTNTILPFHSPPSLSSSSASPPIMPSTSFDSFESLIFSHTLVEQCSIHQRDLRTYCNDCAVNICSQCAATEHSSHFYEAIELSMLLAKNKSLQLVTEVRKASESVRKRIEKVQRMGDDVDSKSIQAAADVRNVIKRCKRAFTERENNLLAIIDQTRYVGNFFLREQMDHLQVMLKQLNEISRLVSGPAQGLNAVELLSLTERTRTELREILAGTPDLPPFEGDFIKFYAPDTSILNTIAGLGYLLVENPLGHRVMRPIVRTNQPSISGASGSSIVRREGPINRAIYGARHIVLSLNSGSIPTKMFGGEGEANGQLCRPWGVCCDRDGNIVVADRSNNRIQVFDPRGSFKFSFGIAGTGPGEFNRPAGITINPEGHIVVADKDNHRIQVFKPDGSFLLTFGNNGIGNGEFNYPWDVACNAIGHIIVSDTRNHRIQLFSSNGTFLGKFGYEGFGHHMSQQFDSPRGVCFSPNGDILVTDFNNHRVAVIDPNLTQATFFGREGSGDNEFRRPQGIICDDEGTIIIADSKNHRIKVLRNDGTLLWKFGREGQGNGELNVPSGICLNPNGHIVVVDFANNRIQVF